MPINLKKANYRNCKKVKNVQNEGLKKLYQ